MRLAAPAGRRRSRTAAPKRASAAGAAGRPARADAPDALSQLAALFHDDIAACNRAIVARMDSPVALIPQLAAHIVAAGGKRLRPLLTLASARLCGYAGERQVRLAAARGEAHVGAVLAKTHGADDTP